MTTAFLGPPGTFSEEAALLRATTDDLVAFTSFPALVSAVETGLADEAVLPIENSIEGAVSTTLDLLIHETALRISGELAVPVRHFLITAPGLKLADVRIVTSHPQPFGQCRRFLDRCLPGVEQVAALSTAGAVQDVITNHDGQRAAIGTARAAELYGGSILAHDIQDVHTNVTRFVVLAREDAPMTGDDKTSIAFRVQENVPGALHDILAELAVENLQLTKIESRPSKGWLGDYVFLIDFEGHRLDERVARVLDRVRERCSMLKIFGSYPRFPLDSLRASIEPIQPID
ncbi:MAG TPA: prephenate dehydratase [Thermomicrobiales bacterium]|nr:prephenate dehydratase [Thermomicrobiales bacterium]